MLFYHQSIYWLALAAVIAACLGSLLNVIIYRLPLMLLNHEQRYISTWLQQQKIDSCGIERLIHPHPPAVNLFWPPSHCPQCQTSIRFYDNIPILSWCLLRGRCRHCHHPIALRYPLVELTLTMIGLVLAYGLPPGVSWGAWLVFSALLLALALIDYDCQQLPDPLTLTLLWIGLLWHSLYQPAMLSDAIWGAIAGYLCLWLVYWFFWLLTAKEGLGYGDFKLLAALGAWGGWQLLPMIILLAAGITLFAFAWQYWRHAVPLNHTLAFGPGLAIAGWGMIITEQLLPLSW